MAGGRGAPLPQARADAGDPTLDESRLRSALAGECWPALPAGPGALALALAYQLEQSQWWPRERLERAQFRQLAAVLEHAARTVPWYRHRFAAATITSAYESIPCVAKRHICPHHR